MSRRGDHGEPGAQMDTALRSARLRSEQVEYLAGIEREWVLVDIF
jgi:hypothetical protein